MTDHEDYKRGYVSVWVCDINLDYVCEPLTSFEVYINYLKDSWPKREAYEYFKLTGSGYDGELSDACLSFYKTRPETDEEFERRVFILKKEFEKRKMEYKRWNLNEETKMKLYVKNNSEKIKQWLSE